MERTAGETISRRVGIEVTGVWYIFIGVLVITSPVNVWCGAGAVAFAAFYLARAAGVPAWRNWESGDATDVGLLTFFGILLLMQ